MQVEGFVVRGSRLCARQDCGTAKIGPEACVGERNSGACLTLLAGSLLVAFRQQFNGENQPFHGVAAVSHCLIGSWVSQKVYVP